MRPRIETGPSQMQIGAHMPREASLGGEHPLETVSTSSSLVDLGGIPNSASRISEMCFDGRVARPLTLKSQHFYDASAD